MAPDHPEEQLSFRPMRPDDLPQLRAWLAEPHVAEWWDDAEETTAGVEAAASGAPRTADQVTPWIVELDSKAVGFVQWYRVEGSAEWFPGVDIPPGTVAIDLAIGDPSLVGVGLGRRVVLEFVHHVLRAAAPDSPEVWIDPNPRNQRAVRAYRAAGFHDTGVDLPDPEHPGEVRRLMRLRWAGPTFR